MQVVKMPPSPMDVLAPANCICGYGECCVCPDTERALRNVQSRPGHYLTAEQREWCKTEIDQVEGYSRKDYERSDDSEIARGVLNAWTDYCRDKGLL